MLSPVISWLSVVPSVPVVEIVTSPVAAAIAPNVRFPVFETSIFPVPVLAEAASVPVSAVSRASPEPIPLPSAFAVRVAFVAVMFTVPPFPSVMLPVVAVPVTVPPAARTSPRARSPVSAISVTSLLAITSAAVIPAVDCTRIFPLFVSTSASVKPPVSLR